MRTSPPLWTSIPPTIRAIISRSATNQTRLITPIQSKAASSQGVPTLTTDEVVSIKGWVKTIRAHKNVSFAAITDGSTDDTLQAVLKGPALPDELHQGSSVELKGRLKPSRGAGQAVELLVEETKVIGECDPAGYPIQKKHLPEHVLRDQAHLRFKTSLTGATMRVRDALMREWHDWFEDHEFVHIHTPILTSSDCEGAGEVFRIHDPPVPSSSTSPTSPPSTFFPRPVNLTVSSQLHLEAPTHALSRTYTLSPSFRSEKSMTSRHLAEFYMLEGEVVVETLDALLDIVEAGIRQSLHRIAHGDTPRSERIRRDLAAIALAQTPERESVPETVKNRPDLKDTASKAFTRITYTDAVDLINLHTSSDEVTAPAKWGVGLSSEHEKFLAKHFHGPVFVTHYPASLKPFYMLPSDATPDFVKDRSSTEPTVACFDLLVPGLGELIGGSLREHRLEHLQTAMQRAGLKAEDYSWYLDLRKYGTMPHGGWGMGWERYITWVTGIHNVRDVVAFPRWMGHCKY